MADETAVIEAPKTFPGTRNAKEEMAELNSLWSPVPAPGKKEAEPEPQAKPAPATVTPEPGKEPVKPAAAPEPTEQDDEQFLAKDEIPKAKKDWDARKAAEARRLARKEAVIAQLARERDEAKKSQPITKIEDDPRWQAKEKEIADYSERLRVHDIENHPKFKAFYDNKINTQIDMAKRIVGKENEERVVAILNLADGDYRNQQIEEFSSGLSTTAAARLGAVLNSMDEIRTDRKTQIDAAKADFSKMQEQENSRKETESKTRMQQAEKLFNDSIKAFNDDKNGLDMFKPIDGNEEHNKGVNARIEYAKALLFGNHQPQELVAAALKVASFPSVVASHQNALKRIAELEGQVKSMTASQPKLEGNHKADSAAPDKKENKGSKFIRDTRSDTVNWMKGTFADAEQDGE